MGYSRNKISVEKVKPILDILLSSDEELEFPSPDPYKLAYYIRDGLSVAKSLPSSPYKNLHEKWKLRIKRDKVVAELKGVPIQIDVSLLTRKFVGLTLPDVTEVMEVIGAAIKHKAPKYSFPNAVITGNGLLNLGKWCDANSYLISQTEPYLILEKNGKRTDDTKVD